VISAPGFTSHAFSATSIRRFWLITNARGRTFEAQNESRRRATGEEPLPTQFVGQPGRGRNCGCMLVEL
jgi:hypothetical protein